MDEELVRVRMTREMFGLIATRGEGGHRLHLDWGEPDADGFCTPTVTVDLDDPTPQDMADGAALRRLREALPEGYWFEVGNAHKTAGAFYGRLLRTDDDADDGYEQLHHDIYPTIAEAADACREKLEARR